MHELCKVTEQQYFLQRMRMEHDNPTGFRFELSAFLGAARSVLQYALKEAKCKPGGREWYEQAVKAEPLLGFFKDKRDANIHTTPVKPATTMTTQVSEFLPIDEETTIPYRHNTSAYRHKFVNWPGDETAVERLVEYPVRAV